MAVAAMVARPHTAPHAVIGHHIRQQTFTQAAVRYPEAIGGPYAADGFEDGAAGQHEIGAVGADAGIGDPLLELPAEQPVDHPFDIEIVHP